MLLRLLRRLRPRLDQHKHQRIAAYRKKRLQSPHPSTCRNTRADSTPAANHCSSGTDTPYTPPSPASSTSLHLLPSPANTRSDNSRRLLTHTFGCMWGVKNCQLPMHTTGTSHTPNTNILPYPSNTGTDLDGRASSSKRFASAHTRYRAAQTTR